ncbi:discoidin domain-containing protein [Clostridium sp. YIM B02505]|uniref:glucan endo-1,3-beta-D-glucosidase n=1 Tax=Clostridium yunnanense TaxID=2800325 RepID=A0ABS1EP45_9CLOT|nr:discoidin domain-containing protein [Clostridium yunnanense]MBK1811142.1 discoidin domain-containing protein [Clostridium yunnanense]
MFKHKSMSRKKFRKSLSYFTALCMAFSVVQTTVISNTTAKAADTGSSYLLSQNRTVYASSSNGGSTTDKMVDGDVTSRWESEWGKDDQWLYVDLGASANITEVKINWEGAYAKDFTIDVCDDESSWQPIHNEVNGSGGNEDIKVTGKGRYVRLHLTKRALIAYGYSIFEFQVFGTGGLNQPPAAPLGQNVALNKNVVASGIHEDWYIKPGEVDPKKAVDGDLNTRWGSPINESQWIYVDLGAPHTIGRVILNWDSPARIYDIEVSDDATNWKKVYRTLNGRGGEENIPLYATGRYVRMNGITRGTTYEFGLREFRVYDYVTGDPKPVYTIPALPASTVTSVGSGSYVSDQTLFPQPKEPFEKTSNLTSPLPSNDWWQSILIKNLGDALITLPLKAKYQKEGLGLLTPSAGWVQDRTVQTEKNIDLFLMANNINSPEMNSKISGYGDYSASVVLSDNDTAKMKTTFVKGSPYVFTEFSDPNSAELYSTVVSKIFDDNGNSVLANDKDYIVADHIGIEVTNVDGAPTPKSIKRYYGVFAPQGTTFKRVGSKIKMQLGGGQNYLSMATMPSAGDLNYFYKHGYAFVTDTKATYHYDGVSSNVTTTFTNNVSLKRTDLANTTLMSMLPAQWKASSDSKTTLTYPSVRGTLKIHEGNSFNTVDKFNGIVPQFTEPLNSEYSRTELLKYLANLDKETTNYMAGDAYWEGKNLHPLAMGLLIADQINATEYKNKFITRLKTILTDWYTYTPGETEGYYFNYNKEWGTLIYKNSEFGANTGITDHHFTYGYFTFASAVLATYDQDFLKNYGSMVDTLIRDYVNPSRTDSMFPQFRNFDPYEGHSWAGGYSDNWDGNNQEAAGESLFGWVGQYLWGKVSGNTTYRDAGIYGFTTELRSIEQYWFNYDGDNWISDYTHKTIGQAYGSTNFYGTFFNGDSVYVYGIHWLPTSEYLTNYGIDKAKAAGLYEGMKNDIINDYNKSTDPNKGAAPDPNNVEPDWKHITWPIQALSDPKAVVNKWNPAQVQTKEAYNTYWFVNSMATLGQRTNDVWAQNGEGASIYKNGTSYTALVWNPSSSPITVKFANASGEVGYTTVAPKTMVSVDPFVKNSVSKTALKAEMNYDNTLNVNDYTADSWKTFNTALANAKSVNDNAAATNDQVITALNNLRNAVQGLVKKTAVPGTDTNIAAGKVAVSSSNEADGLGAQNITDTSLDSRWSSNWPANKDNHPEYVYVDLGQPYFIGDVKVNWSDAYAKGYLVQTASVSPALESSWSTVATITDGAGGIRDSAFNSTAARYVRIYCTSAATQWGYSIKDISIFGASNKTQLSAKINEAISLKSTDYTSESWGVLTNALNNAKNINADTKATQDTIDAALQTLTNAINSLVKSSTPVNSGDNLALNKKAVSSSNEADGLGAQNVTDSDLVSRWSSNWAANKDNHPEFVYVDLASAYDVSDVKVLWDTAYAKGYDLQVCTADPTIESNWKTVASITNGLGSTVDTTFTKTSAKYVRIYCKDPATQWGYSIRNIEIR